MSDAMRLRSKCEEQSPWSNLPLHALEKICSFLNRSDRVSASLVSPSWSNVFESPSLWKSFRFARNMSILSSDDGCSWMDCVSKYSRYFKHVRIFFDKYMESKEFVIWVQNFKTFLKILTNTSRIVSIRIENLGDCFETLESLEKSSTCKSILEELFFFLGSQQNLERLEFICSQFKDEDGIKILKESFKNSKDSLKTLALQDFFYYEYEELNPTIEQVLPLTFDLPNLLHLEIDYWLIFGKGRAVLSDVLKKLTNCRRETHLIIWTDMKDLIDSDDFKFLTSSEWRDLKRHCPYLDMVLFANNFTAAQLPPESLILEHMPISILEYNLDCRTFNLPLEIEIDTFLNHITSCKINHGLVYFALEWSEPIDDVESVIIPFLRVCPKLKSFVFRIGYRSNNLDVLLESLLNNSHPSLKEFRLKIYEVEKEVVKPLRKIGSIFESLFEAVNLNLGFSVEEIDSDEDESDENESDDEILETA